MLALKNAPVEADYMPSKKNYFEEMNDDSPIDKTVMMPMVHKQKKEKKEIPVEVECDKMMADLDKKHEERRQLKDEDSDELDIPSSYVDHTLVVAKQHEPKTKADR